MIRTQELFTADECRQVALVVEDLRPYWEQTTLGTRGFVLGAASYIHASGEPAGPRYHDRARRLTPVLTAHLGWMYDRLATALRAVLGAPAVLAEGLGPPGFHIYRWEPGMSLAHCSVHCDLQFEAHDFTRYGAPDFAEPLSFTVAISAPPSGAGMRIWPHTIQDARARARERGQFRAELATTPPREVRYGLGELTMHSGLHFHQIAPIELAPQQQRLTLQGHAVRCDGTWQLYW